MNETLHIKILKDYAVNVISDLKTMGAVEVVSDEEIAEIPQWQIDEVRRTKVYYEQHPNEFLTWEDVLKQLKYK